MYRQAIKYPYTCTVKTSGTGTIRTWSADEYDVPGAQASATFSLNVTSGTMHSYTIKDADGNNVELQGNAHDWSSFWFVMPKKDVTATVVFWADWPKQGEGTEASPYLISSTDDWNNFAHNVKLGRSYSGNYVKLTKDISVSQFAGDNESTPFSGHFDGGGHTIDCHLEKGSDFVAPFPVTKDATFKNLTLKGFVNVVWNHSYLGGIVGHAQGTTTFTNCRVSTTLECKNSNSRDVSGGGFVGAANNVTFEGCVFDGRLIGSNAYNCGGFGGYVNKATITDCLFKPSEVTFSTTGCHTFIRMSSGTPTITNCYYTQTLGAAQGTEAIFTAYASSNIGSLVQDYGMVKTYENGLLFDGKYYFAPATITGTVYLYVPSGKQITCTGAHASGTTGGGAGIELTAGNTLYIIGSGKLVATGGNAANGGNGAGGGDASFTEYGVRAGNLISGDGGRGGNGGGGAGAGIGTRGGNGGEGGNGGAAKQNTETTGNAGSNGQNGGTAAEMGTLYIYDGFQALTPQTTIQGGSQGTSGQGGTGGRHALCLDEEEDNTSHRKCVLLLYNLDYGRRRRRRWWRLRRRCQQHRHWRSWRRRRRRRRLRFYSKQT